MEGEKARGEWRGGKGGRQGVSGGGDKGGRQEGEIREGGEG